MLVALYEQLVVQSIVSDLSTGDSLVILDITESIKIAPTRRRKERV